MPSGADMTEGEWLKLGEQLGWTQSGLYQTAMRNIDAFIAYFDAVLAWLPQTLEGARLGLCVNALRKTAAHLTSLRNVAPDPENLFDPRKIWDAASIAALARCIVEGHDAFMYTGQRVDAEEGDLRFALWRLHGLMRSIEISDALGSVEKAARKRKIELPQLLAQVKGSRRYGTLNEAIRGKLFPKKAESPPALDGYMRFTTREFYKEFDNNQNYRTLVQLELSQQVHSLPISIMAQMKFRAGDDLAIADLRYPIFYLLPFLSRMALAIPTYFDGEFPRPNPELQKVIERNAPILGRAPKVVYPPGWEQRR